MVIGDQQAPLGLRVRVYEAQSADEGRYIERYAVISATDKTH